MAQLPRVVVFDCVEGVAAVAVFDVVDFVVPEVDEVVDALVAVVDLVALLLPPPAVMHPANASIETTLVAVAMRRARLATWGRGVRFITISFWRLRDGRAERQAA